MQTFKRGAPGAVEAIHRREAQAAGVKLSDGADLAIALRQVSMRLAIGSGQLMDIVMAADAGHARARHLVNRAQELLRTA